MTKFDLKRIGIILIVISVVLFFVLYMINSLVIKLRLELHETCPLPPESCPYKGSVPTEMLGAFIIDGMIGIFGASLIITSTYSEKITTKEKKVKESIKSLQDDEKKVYDLIVEAEGFVFQNDLIKKIGYSKVKISRILDKLEIKGIIERRRRGMSNIVVLKGV